MNWKKISLLVLILLVADQALKIWVKTCLLYTSVGGYPTREA